MMPTIRALEPFAAYQAEPVDPVFFLDFGEWTTTFHGTSFQRTGGTGGVPPLSARASPSIRRTEGDALDLARHIRRDRLFDHLDHQAHTLDPEEATRARKREREVASILEEVEGDESKHDSGE